MINKTLIVTAFGYQLLPKDVLSREKYGLLGFLDNSITLGVTYNRVKSSITPELEMLVANSLNNWYGESIQKFEDYEVIE